MLRLPGAGTMWLGCKIDFITTGSGSSVEQRSPAPSQGPKQVPVLLGTGYLTLTHGEVAEPPPWGPLFCQSHSGNSSMHQIEFSAIMITNTIFSLFYSHCRILKRYQTAFTWNTCELSGKKISLINLCPEI